MRSIMHRIKFEKESDGSEPDDLDDPDNEPLPCESFEEGKRAPFLTWFSLIIWSDALLSCLLSWA
jgi:hypothetical protein